MTNSVGLSIKLSFIRIDILIANGFNDFTRLGIAEILINSC